MEALSSPVHRPTLENDPWLGAVLGRAALRLTFRPIAETYVPPPPPAPEAVFIYAKVDVGELERVRILESLDFNLVDTNITFAKAMRPEPAGLDAACVRMARREDEGAAVALARASFTKSRFHNDPLIPKAVADELKGEWVRNYFLRARGDAMVVAEEGGRLTGFLLLLDAGDALIIDLVAVADRQRGRGVAAAMTRFAEASFPRKSLIRVGTQIGNAAAIRSYQRMGFALERSQYIFHYHGALPPALAGGCA